MKCSPYIRWAKSRARVRYNLARSGVPTRPLADLKPRPEDLEIRADGPGNLDGWPPLLDKLAQRHGLDPSQVVTAHGNSMANHLVMAALLEPGDEVLAESPVYEPLHLVPTFLGARVAFFQRSAAQAFDIDPQRIEALVSPNTRLVVLSNLHNPSGALASREALLELGRLAEHYGFDVLVDEVYLELLHGLNDSPAALLSPRFISTRSLTKAYGLDGLRMGWILCRPELAQRIRQLQGLYSITCAHPSERLAARALDLCQDLLGPMRNQADRNRWAVDSLVAGHPLLEWVKPATGILGWVRLKQGSVDGLIERLESQYDTSLAPGRFFGDQQCFRISFGIQGEDLREALSRLEKALKQQPAGRDSG